ncbi:hypothetical protein TW82_19295, partial [Pseudoalteromonas fuliginea]
FIIFSCVYNKRKFYVWHLLFFGGITTPSLTIKFMIATSFRMNAMINKSQSTISNTPTLRKKLSNVDKMKVKIDCSIGRRQLFIKEWQAILLY